MANGGSTGSQAERLYCKNGCVAKIFKLIKIKRVIAVKTNSSTENRYTFYTFYLPSTVECILF